MDTTLFQSTDQINGADAHKAVDEHRYSSKKSVFMGLDVYSETYHLVGKIDIFYADTGILTERKKKIKTVYDGYVFQLYGQYFALTEMGYSVKELRLYSMDDNKVYPLPLPEEDPEMLAKFVQTIHAIRTLDIATVRQTNAEKCAHCIYEPACDRGLI